MFQENGAKQAGVATLLSDKINFSPKIEKKEITLYPPMEELTNRILQF